MNNRHAILAVEGSSSWILCSRAHLVKISELGAPIATDIPRFYSKQEMMDAGWSFSDTEAFIGWLCPDCTKFKRMKERL